MITDKDEKIIEETNYFDGSLSQETLLHFGWSVTYRSPFSDFVSYSNSDYRGYNVFVFNDVFNICRQNDTLGPISTVPKVVNTYREIHDLLKNL